MQPHRPFDQTRVPIGQVSASWWGFDMLLERCGQPMALQLCPFQKASIDTCLRQGFLYPRASHRIVLDSKCRIASISQDGGRSLTLKTNKRQEEALLCEEWWIFECSVLHRNPQNAQSMAGSPSTGRERVRWAEYLRQAKRTLSLPVEGIRLLTSSSGKHVSVDIIKSPHQAYRSIYHNPQILPSFLKPRFPRPHKRGTFLIPFALLMPLFPLPHVIRIFPRHHIIPSSNWLQQP